VSLAAAIKNAFDVETTLQIGTPGQFEVTLDGQIVFSKHAEGRFPEHQEVLDAMSKLAVR
jgi:selT/selW/selH-like putative selenoprotein